MCAAIRSGRLVPGPRPATAVYIKKPHGKNGVAMATGFPA